MRRIAIIVAILAAAPASAQVADQMSRQITPNAIDRSLSQPSPSRDLAAQAEADRRRSEQAARDAATRMGPLPNSTMSDGPLGPQRAGSSAPAISPAAPPPLPPSPATPNREGG